MAKHIQVYRDTSGNLGASNPVLLAGEIAFDTTTGNFKIGDGTTAYNSLNYFKNVSSLNLSQGQVLNGKLVPSVASNNLTVALKTLAGADATASTPIYIRIFDTIHTITSALSVTCNAGTNWLNLGSSELATQETDLFVYATYSATFGYALMLSRIPYIQKGDEFSAGLDSEKGTTSLNIDNTVFCENIGRISIKLSAGAGYTWTLGTGLTINRPIFETRLLKYVPTLTASESMTVSGGDAQINNSYQIVGNTITVNIQDIITIGGTASYSVYNTVPLSAKPLNMSSDGGFTGSVRIYNSITGSLLLAGNTPNLIDARIDGNYNSGAYESGYQWLRGTITYNI